MAQATLTSLRSDAMPHRLGNQSQARLARVQKELAESGCSGLLIYAFGESETAGAVRYLTGFMPNGESVCWIPVAGEAIAINNDKNAARAWATVLSGQATVLKTTDLIATLREVLAAACRDGDPLAVAGLEQAPRARACELDKLVRRYPRQDGQAIVTRLRTNRTPFEEDRQRAATRVADGMVQPCMQVAAIPGVTGLDIMAEVEFHGRRLGADRATCWLAIGDRPAETYMVAHELADRISAGDRVQIGTTVMFDGYFSQVLRIGVFGEPSRRLVEVGDALIAMQDAALQAMRPGRSVVDIGDVLERMIDDFCPYARAEDPFRFQSCHAMGNSYSEPWSAPYLNADRDRTGDEEAPKIAVHQTYEIHPNFTLPDVGHVCAGDVGLVTEAGGQWISHTPRGLLRLD